MKAIYVKPEIEKIYSDVLMANEMTTASVGMKGRMSDDGASDESWEFGGDGKKGDDPDAKWNDHWDMWD